MQINGETIDELKFCRVVIKPIHFPDKWTTAQHIEGIIERGGFTLKGRDIFKDEHYIGTIEIESDYTHRTDKH